jgi:hypothetical protein
VVERWRNSPGGRALEFGIGTGRIALRSRRGACGSPASTTPTPCWLGYAQTGAGDIEIAVGDFAGTRVEGVFSLVYWSSTRSPTS